VYPAGSGPGGLPASLVPLCKRQVVYVVNHFPASEAITPAVGTTTPLMGQSCAGEAEVVHQPRGKAGNLYDWR